MTHEGKLRASDWFVADVPTKQGKQLVQEHHYARGGSNTAVYLHGLYRRSDGTLCGVVWWLPPTRVASESVNRDAWRQVLSLTRMVIVPGVPKNAATFLLARSVRLIRQARRFVSLVTYADESQGHTGGVYRAANWTYVGKTKAYPRWVDAEGRQVAKKATTNRTYAQMDALGFRRDGAHAKHKFVLHI